MCATIQVEHAHLYLGEIIIPRSVRTHIAASWRSHTSKTTSSQVLGGGSQMSTLNLVFSTHLGTAVQRDLLEPGLVVWRVGACQQTHLLELCQLFMKTRCGIWQSASRAQPSRRPRRRRPSAPHHRRSSSPRTAPLQEHEGGCQHIPSPSPAKKDAAPARLVLKLLGRLGHQDGLRAVRAERCRRHICPKTRQPVVDPRQEMRPHDSDPRIKRDGKIPTLAVFWRARFLEGQLPRWAGESKKRPSRKSLKVWGCEEKTFLVAKPSRK